MIEAVILHAVEHGHRCKISFWVPCTLRKHRIQRIFIVVRIHNLAQPILRLKTLHRCAGAIGAPARRDAALRIDRRDHIFRQWPIGAQLAILKIPSVRDLEIARKRARHIAIHVKTIHERHYELEEHHSERQRNNRDKRLAAAAAEIGPGHGEDGNFFLRALALRAARTFCIAQRFDR